MFIKLHTSGLANGPPLLNPDGGNLTGGPGSNSKGLVPGKPSGLNGGPGIILNPGPRNSGLKRSNGKVLLTLICLDPPCFLLYGMAVVLSIIINFRKTQIHKTVMALLILPPRKCISLYKCVFQLKNFGHEGMFKVKLSGPDSFHSLDLVEP